jgi:hydroxymethylglutaryl-CoA lyase
MNSNTLPKFVKIVEVGPRDGLQNERELVSVETKVELIDRLSRAGFQNIEAAAFVSPKWTPQMASSDEVMARIERRDGCTYSALTPNMQGFERALKCKADEVVIFSAASEAFAQKNINCSVQESIQRYIPVAKAAKDHSIKLRGSISCAFGCPYQGEVSSAEVVNVVRRMLDLGCDEIDIADTIGVGTALHVQKVFGEIFSFAKPHMFSAHFHDTYGQSLANIFAALQTGVSIIHSSVAGLGGCPYAKGATGNVATEDVLYMMQGLGIETGINLNEVVQIGAFISSAIGLPYGSRAGKALYRQHI